jgi:catechol 2,3-dioxygenase-like lactoylglutathione lyase family enzyme
MGDYARLCFARRARDHVAMRHRHQKYVGGELVLVIDCSDLERSATFWCDALGYRRDGPAVGQYQGLFPSNGHGIQLLLQRVDDRKLAKNRIHLDLRTSKLGPEVERIRAAGGRVVTGKPMAEFGWTWQILADPDGNELCVVEPPPEHWQA